MLVPALAGVINVFASSPIFVVSTRLRAAPPGHHRDLPHTSLYLPISPLYLPAARPPPRHIPHICPISAPFLPHSPLHLIMCQASTATRWTACISMYISLCLPYISGEYRGAMNCLRETLAEGAASLWSGLVPVSRTRLQPRTSKAWLGLGLGYP